MALPNIGLSSQTDSPRFECEGYREMKDMWELVEDLLGGTLTMREAGIKWLPQEDGEEPRSYTIRIERSVLYNGFGDTVEKLAARPFSKPLTIKGTLPQQLQWMLVNADRRGQPFEVVAHEQFRDGVAYGLAHWLVDYPIVENNITLAQEEAAKIAPYIKRIEPDDLIFWDEDNDGNLLEIRYSEDRVLKEGVFGQKCVEYIIQWTPDTVTEYEMNGVSVVNTISRTHTHKRIPLFTFYTERTGFMTANPPLEDLAWMNVAHWQSYSDQRNILRFARMGILAMTGITAEERDKATVIAANRALKSTSPEAKFFYVEHSGKAIGAGANDIATIEEKMMVLGMQPLFESSGKATATGRAMDESRSSSLAQSWALEFAKFLEAVLRYAADIIEQPLGADFKVTIYNEFSLSLKAGLDVQALLAMRQAGQISHATFLDEMKRRSVLSESVVIEEEMAQAKKESQQAMATAQAQQSQRQKSVNNMRDPVVNPAGI